MELKIKYDISEISEDIKTDVKNAVEREIVLSFTAMVNEIKNDFLKVADEISARLEINDPKQRERMRRALTHNLDKWTKEVLKK